MHLPVVVPYCICAWLRSTPTLRALSPRVRLCLFAVLPMPVATFARESSSGVDLAGESALRAET
jgi:hypothetical protein